MGGDRTTCQQRSCKLNSVPRRVASNQIQDQLSTSCRSPFHLLLPHVCSSEGGESSERVTASPPPKRPEVFPPPKGNDEHSLSGKGKRKIRDSGAGVVPDQLGGASGIPEVDKGDGSGPDAPERPGELAAGEEDNLAQGGASSKRFKEEKARDGKKGTRAPAPASGIKLRPLSGGATHVSSGSWSEHRDAVSDRTSQV